MRSIQIICLRTVEDAGPYGVLIKLYVYSLPVSLVLCHSPRDGHLLRAETPLRALPRVGFDFADNYQLSAPLRVTAREVIFAHRASDIRLRRVVLLRSVVASQRYCFAEIFASRVKRCGSEIGAGARLALRPRFAPSHGSGSTSPTIINCRLRSG